MDTKFDDKDIVATIAMIHGFSENQSISHFEGALMHAMNGFEVIMVDYKGFGFSSGPRGGGFKVQDAQEWVGVCLQQARTDRPLFVQAHSLGCATTQGLVYKNPEANFAGLIYGAPFFDFAEHQKLTPKRLLECNFIKSVGDEIPLNPLMQAHWVCHDPMYWRKLQYVDGTALAVVSGGLGWSMMYAVSDCVNFAHRHTLPTLVVTAGKDKVVDNKGARDFIAKIKTPADKKQLKLFYNGYHQIHKEP